MRHRSNLCHARRSHGSQWHRLQLLLLPTLLAAILAAAAFAPPRAQADAYGVLSGTVRDAVTGQPLNHVEVHAGHYVNGVFQSQGLAFTDQSGSYLMSLMPGDYLVRMSDGLAYVPEWYGGQRMPATATAVSIASGQTTVADAALTPAEFGTIVGCATDADTGQSLQATVFIRRYEPDLDTWTLLDPVHTAYAPPNQYSVDVPAGRYKLEFVNSSYRTTWYASKPSQETADIVTVEGGKTVTADCAMPYGQGEVVGQVVDEYGGGIAGITVEALTTPGGTVAATARTDGLGFYRLPCTSGRAPELFKLHFTDPSGEWREVYYHDAPDLAVAESVQVTPPLTRSVATQTMHPVHPFRIVGAVRDTGGAPLVGVSVTARDATNAALSWSARTDASGAYAFDTLPTDGTDHYIVGCPEPGDGYLPEWWAGEDSADKADWILARPGPAVTADLFVEKAGTISGTVSGPHGPLAGIQVVAAGFEAQATATTDAHGDYRMGGLRPDVYSLYFGDPTGTFIGCSYQAPPTGRITIEGNSFIADQILDIACTIAGRVWGADGSPLTGALASVYDTGGTLVESELTLSDGTYQLRFLRPGSYKVCVGAAGYATEYFDGVTAWSDAAVIQLSDQATRASADVILDQRTAGTVGLSRPDGAMFDSVTLPSSGGVLSLSGDTAVMSSGLPDMAADVYVRGPQGWILQQRIPLPADAPVFETPGLSLALDGDTLALGIHSSDGRGDKVGCVYLYTRAVGRWTQQARLAPSPTDPDYLSFGERVALSGDSLLVGAPFVKVGTKRWAGVAYAYQRSGATWTKVGRLVAKDGGEDDYFGCDIEVDGSRAVLGAYMDDTSDGVNHGSAYVFVRSGETWTQEAKLNVVDEDRGPQIGSAVAISATTVALAGERAADERGAVYVFVRSDGVWKQQTRLVARDAILGDYAGYDLALSDDRILVTSRGSYSSTASWINRGVVYLYERSGSTWRQMMRFAPSSTERYMGYGGSVAIAGPDLFITAPNEGINTDGYRTGRVHVFSPYITEPGIGLTIDAAHGLLVNDLNGSPTPGTLTATLLTVPSHGQLQLATDGSFTYTPVQGFVGVDTFTYAATCGEWQSAPGLVSVNVRDANAPSISPTDLPIGWINTPITVTLAAPASASDMASIDYKKVTAGRWIRYIKPFTVSSQGASNYATRARDVFGNVNTAGRFTVRVDTKKPTPRAAYAASGAYHGKMTFRYKIVDPRPGSPTANVTIIVKNAAGHSMGDVVLKGKTVNKLVSSTVSCWLRRGTYKFYVAATDRAGNQQTKLATNKLVIK